MDNSAIQCVISNIKYKENTFKEYLLVEYIKLFVTNIL